MGLLLSLIDGVVGIVGSFLGAMNSTELATVGRVARRWLLRIGHRLWPDVRDPADGESPSARPDREAAAREAGDVKEGRRRSRRPRVCSGARRYAQSGGVTPAVSVSGPLAATCRKVA